MTLDARLTRIDANRVQIGNVHGIDAVLFANEQVPIESAAVTELLEMLELHQTMEKFAETSGESFDRPPAIKQVAVTPDFHKDRGIPVGTVLATQGFVVPQAIGNDINCGMRLHLTSLQADEISGTIEELDTAFRQIFFEGGRNIPMTRVQREGLFKNGLTGLLDATPKTLTDGLWPLVHELDVERDLDRVDRRGDGALGLWAALREVFPTTREQRCWVHKTANVLNKMPKGLQAKAKSDLHQIWLTETREAATKAFDHFLEKYGVK